ncbi:type VI secretion system accessory protein TagJ [Ottowia sp. VDI28]|uniref:type VI secretion system accessory protein TagJ n=1 Tax=Ottowia sp. VDI28 TaxID=3133968 RepID=UPI003C2E05D4
MSAEELLKAGDTAGSLAALTEQVRAKPGDSKARVFLAQLLCVQGQWERALNQLNVAAELDALAVPMKQVYGDAIRCEGLRIDVFAGRRTPMVFGQPDEWLALLIESLLQSGQGNDPGAAQALRQRAFDSAPATSGQLDGQAFEWIADADMRLGPVLEAYVNSRYYWIPFARLSKVTIEPPEDLRDCVWTPANLVFANGGEALALIPTRYPGSERSAEGALQLARRTEWIEPAPGQWTGLGQRMLSTDAGEHALMDVREIALDVSGAPAGDPPGEVPDA